MKPKAGTKPAPGGAPTPGPGAEPAGPAKSDAPPTPAADAAPPVVEPAAPEPPAAAADPTPAAATAPPAVEPAEAGGYAPEADSDDVTLARKVESEVFRDAGAPKGKVDVNAASGTVWLRGELESADAIEDLVRRTLRVRGVKRVESLLHTPGSPPPEPSPAGREPVRARAGD
jgi:hypothetical protein